MFNLNLYFIKKIILFIAAMLAFQGFSNAKSLDKAMLIENHNNLDEDLQLYSFEISINLLETCTGTLTYLGVPIASFVGFGDTMEEACEMAREAARNYILSLGDDPGF